MEILKSVRSVFFLLKLGKKVFLSRKYQLLISYLFQNEFGLISIFLTSLWKIIFQCSSQILSFLYLISPLTALARDFTFLLYLSETNFSVLHSTKSFIQNESLQSTVNSLNQNSLSLILLIRLFLNIFSKIKLFLHNLLISFPNVSNVMFVDVRKQFFIWW